MNQKERLEQIRKKHEEERKRKRIFYNRIIFAAGVAVVILLIVLGIRGCASHIAERREQKRLEEQKRQEELAATLQPTPMPTINPREISQAYYAGSAFIGNSFIDDLFMCNFLEDADYFAKTGLSVTDAMTEATELGTVPVIDELGSGKKYNKVFMMFGENELGWPEGSFIQHYRKLVDKAKQLQPDAEIYLMSITPITRTASEADIDNTNNDQIRVYNKFIKELAAEEGAVFADVYQAVVNEDGELPANAASDGVHFGKDYYEKCLLYIQNHYR